MILYDHIKFENCKISGFNSAKLDVTRPFPKVCRTARKMVPPSYQAVPPADSPQKNAIRGRPI
jgi:hypothetical protein